MEKSFHFTFMVLEKSQCAVPASENDQKLEKQLGNGENTGVIFINISKAFYSINDSLVLIKMKAYSFSDQALSLLQSYLCNIFQRSIINGSFCNWNEVITVVSQSSMLGPVLFNVVLNDIFLFISKC